MSRSAVPISKELDQWLRDCIAHGHDREAVRAALRSHGYDRNMAERICTQAFGAAPAPARGPAQPAVSPAFAPDQGEYSYWFEPAWPLVGGHQRNRIASDHGEIRILARSERPYVVALGNVLTADECAALIEYARPNLKRAEVVGANPGESMVDERRTADETVIELGETPLVARIDARIRELTGLPVAHGEGLQVMHYRVGGEYQPHFDFFDGATPGSLSRLRFGQRVATMVIYLNDVEAGGETAFPDAGIEVAPQAGNAVYFAYADAQGRCDRLSFHGGNPVVAGEKWIATKWLRDRPFPSAFGPHPK